MVSIYVETRRYQRGISLSVTRQQVRESFPHATAIADKFKSAFGQIKLISITENGQTIGRKSTEKGVKISEIEIYGDAFARTGIARDKKKSNDLLRNG